MKHKNKLIFFEIQQIIMKITVNYDKNCFITLTVLYLLIE
jgi:hypothetical protein